MEKRTWPYGTRKVIQIHHVCHCNLKTRKICIVFGFDDCNEGWIIKQNIQSLVAMFHKPAEGQRRIIEFREGGPTGGHWAMLDGLDVSAERLAEGVHRERTNRH